VSKAISVVVIGRSLNQEERTCLRTSSQTPLAIVAELPSAPQAMLQTLEDLNRLRPQAALVLLNGETRHSFQLVERIHQEMPETAVICSSEENSSEIILQSFRSGAMEFLRLPLVEAEVTAVFSKIEQSMFKPEEHRGRVIAVYASKGGCGTTFVTANLAASLARSARKHVTVVDLNLQAGDQPLYLGVEPQYSIYDVVRNFDRLDDQLLASYLTHRSKLLTLLAAPTEIGKDEDIRVEHVARSIALLRTHADYILVDSPRMLNELTISALDSADEKILLLTLDIPGIRSAKRTLDIFTRLGYDRSQIKVVVNRYEKTPEFELKQVGKVLETEVFATIANDYQAAISSINVGEPLALSKGQSQMIQDFGRLAVKLTGVSTKPEVVETPARPKSGGWSSLFGGKR
jgi:pilus assembly protein CpaE